MTVNPESPDRWRVLLAPDKFKGTATAPEIAAAMAEAVVDHGGHPVSVPLADGGEGTLDALGGSNRWTIVDGPLGHSVLAPWRLAGDVAVIESALASGLQLVGGAPENDALRASSYGTGQLIVEAMHAGARRVIVGLGGSACTDGGHGCLEAVLESCPGGLPVDLIAACDVNVTFLRCARLFGHQKGADPTEVLVLERRLESVARLYESRFGVDVREVPGAGAAGGLGGGLLALGARLESGFDLIANHVGLDPLLEAADLVLTGEGRFDFESLRGKVVGSVLRLARLRRTRCAVIAGVVDSRLPVEAISLTSLFGEERARYDVRRCVRRATAVALGQGQA